MSIVNYKGYQGSVEFEDRCLVVRILHIDDIISTTFDSASSAEDVFKELVDDYITTCAEVDKEPAKPFKGSFNVRIGPEQHKNAAIMAAEAGESLNNWVAGAIERRIRADSTDLLRQYQMILETPIAGRLHAAAEMEWISSAPQSIQPVVPAFDISNIDRLRELRRSKLHG